MEERLVKTHLIVTSIHEEFDVKWLGRLINTNPLLKDGLPTFILISKEKRVELTTLDMNFIETMAKRITNPHGRAAVTTDKTFIYIKEIGGKETCIGVVVHRHIKSYAPMYDRIGYR